MTKNNFWHDLPRPIKVLAPMAGYTDASFRMLVSEYGADVTISELVSADAIAYGKLRVEKQEFRIKNSEFSRGKEPLVFNRVVSTKNQSTADLLSFFEEERPFVVQLFGKYPEKFGLAAKWVTENLKPDGIDINMGCPARKVVGSDHGAALIKYPELAAEIVRAVKANTDLPVSVKTRLGWDDSSTILEFAPVLYEAGIDAIIIHGRTYKQGFSGEADWSNIYKLKEMLPELVVIGNGGVREISNVKLQISNDTKCGSCVISTEVEKSLNSKKISRQARDDNRSLDGYAIGQATFGNPWLFSGRELDKEELKKLILDHAELVVVTKGEYGLVEFRKHLLKYLSNFPGAKERRKEAVSITTLADIKKIISTI